MGVAVFIFKEWFECKIHSSNRFRIIKNSHTHGLTILFMHHTNCSRGREFMEPTVHLPPLLLLLVVYYNQLKSM